MHTYFQHCITSSSLLVPTLQGGTTGLPAVQMEERAEAAAQRMVMQEDVEIRKAIQDEEREKLEKDSALMLERALEEERSVHVVLRLCGRVPALWPISSASYNLDRAGEGGSWCGCWGVGLLVWWNMLPETSSLGVSPALSTCALGHPRVRLRETAERERQRLLEKFQVEYAETSGREQVCDTCQAVGAGAVYVA